MAKGWNGTGLYTRDEYRRKRDNKRRRIEKRALGKLSTFVASW